MATVQAGSGPVSGEIVIRPCTTVEEFENCVRLQKTIWGFDDVDVLPVRLFVVGAKIGGHVFGAFDGGKLVGFCIAIPGLRRGKPYLHSHMLGVLPEYQNRGLGRSLKLKQREDGLARGVTLVEWTFDPLELKNAFFNIERLGVIVRRYVPNQYGTTSSGLHGGLPTDRLVAEWWLATGRVKSVIERPPGSKPPRRQAERRITVPSEIGRIKSKDRKAALQVQRRGGEEFQEAFHSGLAVTGFEPGEKESAYLLEKYEGPTL